ncbi:MAG: hypothetical protein A3I05_03675 [Deltaproteobacteria bacterium RIFCSPLOWO2_02_FULL_44_10]|nr:MAG: hypothetical protein A3C46_02740 [Deltaproteobacteria bacterium RIFCSPHIGHO2_02_FULL_44_16]OGQ47692.1 MAG: hypothetical protein A3I05_03675 [Deltaproteobacteria bacterium RIFCSPLOWO2_02_FULL_44_10]
MQRILKKIVIISMGSLLLLQPSVVFSATKPLLNSEMIQNKYGSYGVKVLKKTPTLRVSKLYSTHDGKEIARTLAFVIFPKVIDERVREEHVLITEKSQSIGSTFKQRGWIVQKQNRYFGMRPEIPKNVRQLMGGIEDQPLVLHIYELSVEQEGKKIHYCTIAELHHPDYLTTKKLKKIYGKHTEISAPHTISLDEILKLVDAELEKITVLFQEAKFDFQAEKATITKNGKVVRYIGTMSDENVQRLLKETEGQKIKKLIISSSGGETCSAIEFGFWVAKNKIDVDVERACLSSCANYVFPAAKKKKIYQHAVVAWHGNMRQKDLLSEVELKKYAQEMFKSMPADERKLLGNSNALFQKMKTHTEFCRTREDEFFKLVGVDEYVCRIGNEKYDAQGFFFMSKNDMEHFGIKNISMPKNYEKTNLDEFRKRAPFDFIRLQH